MVWLECGVARVWLECGVARVWLECGVARLLEHAPYKYVDSLRWLLCVCIS